MYSIPTFKLHCDDGWGGGLFKIYLKYSHFCDHSSLFCLLTSTRLFSNDDINSLMSNFDYGFEAISIPSPLTSTILQSADKTRLGQTGMPG